MSVYQKFIESATSPRQKPSQPIVFDYRNEQKLIHSTQATKTKNMMIKQNNLPAVAMANSVVGQFASTPISKQQYKRLVEADHRAIRHQEERRHLRQQQQQQHHLEQLYCSANCRQHNCTQQQQQENRQQRRPTSAMDSFFKTDDPVLLKWLQAMRFETELECLTSLQARTLAIDEHSAQALSVRNSQVSIQEMRLESNFILDYIDYLIESLPLKFHTVGKFSIEFSELWTRLTNQTAAQTTASQQQQQQQQAATNNHNQNNLTIINCTPRKSQASVRSLKPLDQLAVQIRNLCIDYANLLYDYQEEEQQQQQTTTASTSTSTSSLDNGQLEAYLRKLKELYGKFVEISIRAECANIVRSLHYDFTQAASLNHLSSTSSLHPVRPFESSSSQLPLKWALIALWQLTKDDGYICRTLTEKWELTAAAAAAEHPQLGHLQQQQAQQTQIPSHKSRSSPVAKRLDYSTKYDKPLADSNTVNRQSHPATVMNQQHEQDQHSLRSDYHKLYQICQNDAQYQRKQRENDENRFASATTGALSNALQRKQLQPTKQVSTIELLIDVIISQPNKHERLDMMNLIHTQAQHDRLIDLDEWDQTVSAAIYTSNQYKVAALRILNHLCVNEQAVKTILKCLSTPPPSQGQPIPENKIIRSIFECYQTSQEHIYQNETMFHSTAAATATSQRGNRKRFCKVQKQQQQQQQFENNDDDYYSDYGSRQTTNSNQTSGSHAGTTVSDDLSDESDDVVVKEAIRLLVQLTTPFHRSNQGLDFYTLIGRFSIDSLVKYLTSIIKSTTSREMLFLSLTALANISFITTEPMRLYETNGIILEMFRASKGRSKDLELRDQAVTILANTADKNLLDIVSNAGLTFLLSCLESCPTRMANYKQLERLRSRDPLASGGTGVDDDQIQRLNIENKPRDRKPIDFSEDFPDVLNCACDQPQQQQGTRTSFGRLDQTSATLLHAPSLCLSRLSPNDLAAMERIHQKTAVAFARMSVDPSTTRMVLKYGGIKKMIDLCKFSHKRNHSDTVLIACIAALRKMAKVIESETFRYYNALDLIELELNQTLEIYGSPRDRQLVDGQQRLFASDV